MTTAEPPAEKLQADVVMATAFGVLKQHWLVLVGLALVLSIPGRAATMLMTDGMPNTLAAHPRLAPLLVQLPAFPVEGATTGILAGWAAWLILGKRSGQTIQPSFLTRNMRDVLLTGVVTGLAYGVGLSLVVIPGILIMAMIAPSLGVAAVEGLGLSGNLRRGYQLTEGSRMTIVGLTVLTILFIGACNLLSGLTSRVVGIDPIGFMILGIPPAQWLVIAINQVITSLFPALVFAALYTELIRIKDGYDPAVEVFA